MDRQPGAWVLDENGELRPDMNDPAMAGRYAGEQKPPEPVKKSGGKKHVTA